MDFDIPFDMFNEHIDSITCRPVTSIKSLNYRLDPSVPEMSLIFEGPGGLWLDEIVIVDVDAGDPRIMEECQDHILSLIKFLNPTIERTDIRLDWFTDYCFYDKKARGMKATIRYDVVNNIINIYLLTEVQDFFIDSTRPYTPMRTILFYLEVVCRGGIYETKSNGVAADEEGDRIFVSDARKLFCFTDTSSYSTKPGIVWKNPKNKSSIVSLFRSFILKTRSNVNCELSELQFSTKDIRENDKHNLQLTKHLHCFLEKYSYSRSMNKKITEQYETWNYFIDGSGKLTHRQFLDLSAK